MAEVGGPVAAVVISVEVFWEMRAAREDVPGDRLYPTEIRSHAVTIEPLVPASSAPQPSRTGLLGLADTVVRARGEARLAEQRALTVTTVAATLAVQGAPAAVTCREPGGAEWTIRIGDTAEAPQS